MTRLTDAQEQTLRKYEAAGLNNSMESALLAEVDALRARIAAAIAAFEQLGFDEDRIRAAYSALAPALHVGDESASVA